MGVQLLPLEYEKPLWDGMQSLVAHFKAIDPVTKVANNLTGYTFTGKVYDEPGGTELGTDAITFANDLANGIVKCYVAEADAGTVYAAGIAAGYKTVYAEVTWTPTGGEQSPLFLVAMPLRKTGG